MPSEIPLPTLNDRAWFSMDENVDVLYPTRVEDANKKTITIGAPLWFENGQTLAPADRPSQGQTCSLVWKVGDQGYAQQHCTLDSVRDGNLILWSVKLRGQAELIQRRQFARVPDDAGAHIYFSDRSTDVQIIDISEGGVRCSLRSFKITVEHFPLFVDLIVGNRLVLLPGQIVRVEERIDGQMEIGVKFTDVNDIQSTLIRRHVFGLQNRNEGSGAA